MFLNVKLQVKDFLYRFASIPDLLELDHLTVAGDVNFGKNVSLRVSIVGLGQTASGWMLREVKWDEGMWQGCT